MTNQSGGVKFDKVDDVNVANDIVARDKITNYFATPDTPVLVNNLPRQQPFFGRVDELKRIADALSPEYRGWGVLIDGTGGIGKTALAVEAAYKASAAQFPEKLYLSAKVRDLTPAGEEKLEDYLLPNYMEMLAELARLLGDRDIAKGDPKDRAKVVLGLLAARHALLIIDNLETFPEEERRRVAQFLNRLPPSCKAIVTSRRRTDVSADIIRLDRLSLEESNSLISNLAANNPILAATSALDRQHLYEVAQGNPLILRWLCGQLGRAGSHCRTVAQAIEFMKAAPQGNDPLEYVMGDLLDTFTDTETAVLAALTHFTQPAKVKWIANTAGMPQPAAQTALEDLTDRSILVADSELRKFLLPPLAVMFIRKARPEVVAKAAENLTASVYALVLENGGRNYDGFKILDDEWEHIAAALPHFQQGENDRLQHLCNKLHQFMSFYGLWDDLLALHQHAEAKALAVQDFYEAGWRIYQTGYVYYLRKRSAEVLTCASRAATHWEKVRFAHVREKAFASLLRGVGHRLANDYPTAIVAHQEALSFWRTLSSESRDVVIGLGALAGDERASGDYAAAERDYREALWIAKKINDREGVAIYTGSLASLALTREEWQTAETLAREALELAEEIGKQEEIADDNYHLAKALARLGKPAEGLPYAQRAVEIYTKLRSPELEEARAVEAECRQGMLTTD